MKDYKCDYCGKELKLDRSNIECRVVFHRWEEFYRCPYCNNINYLSCKELPSSSDEIKFINSLFVGCLILITLIIIIYLGGR